MFWSHLRSLLALIAVGVLALQHAPLSAQAHSIALKVQRTHVDGESGDARHARVLDSVALQGRGKNQLVVTGDVAVGYSEQVLSMLFSTTAPYSWVPSQNYGTKDFKNFVEEKDLLNCNYNYYQYYNEIASYYGGCFCQGQVKLGQVTLPVQRTLLYIYTYSLNIGNNIPWAPAEQDFSATRVGGARPNAVKYPYNGVFALPYTDNTADSFMAAAQQEGLIENNRFAFYIPDEQNATEFYFDTIPENKLAGVMYEPVSLSGSWSVQSIGIEVNGERVLSTPVHITFDPSYSFSYFQEFIGDGIYAAVNKTLVELGYPMPNTNSSSLRIGCSLIPKLPNISIYTHAFKVDITPQQYTTELRIGQVFKVCQFNMFYFLQPQGPLVNLGKNEPQAIFGVDFFRNLTVVFDQDNQRIGVAGRAVTPMTAVEESVIGLVVASMLFYTVAFALAIWTCLRARKIKASLIFEEQLPGTTSKPLEGFPVSSTFSNESD